MPPMDGFVDAAFEGVRDVFADSLAAGRETGGAVAVTVGDRLVVDLWGGWADAARTRPWARDTIVTVYSTGKPLAALATLRLVAGGVLELDEPIAQWWPDFAREGKGGTTLRHALAHQAGVPALDRDEPAETLLDHHRFAEAIAATPPQWEPGTAHGEHALTYGTLLGEVVRRAGGRSLGAVFRDQVAGPLGIDAAIGLHEHELARVAEVEPVDPAWPERALRAPGSLWHRSLSNPAGALDVSVVNGAGWRRGEIPAVNAHADARGLATLYAALLDGAQSVLPRSLLEDALAPQAVGADRVLEREVTWTLGFQRDEGFVGMGGTGGSSAYLGEEQGSTFAYVTRLLGDHARADALADAVEACL